LDATHAIRIFAQYHTVLYLSIFGTEALDNFSLSKGRFDGSSLQDERLCILNNTVRFGLPIAQAAYVHLTKGSV
jgi:hypothetical protein